MWWTMTTTSAQRLPTMHCNVIILFWQMAMEYTPSTFYVGPLGTYVQQKHKTVLVSNTLTLDSERVKVAVMGEPHREPTCSGTEATDNVSQIHYSFETDSYLATVMYKKSYAVCVQVMYVTKVWPWWSFCKCKPRYIRRERQYFIESTFTNKFLAIMLYNYDRLSKLGASRYCQRFVPWW
jgi:hypothetical protein